MLGIGVTATSVMALSASETGNSPGDGVGDVIDFLWVVKEVGFGKCPWHSQGPPGWPSGKRKRLHLGLTEGG